MAWNFLAVIEDPDGSSDLYPTPADNAAGIEVTAAYDASIHTHEADEVVINRRLPGQGYEPMISVRGAIRLVVTDSRVAVVTRGVVAFGGPLETNAGRPAADGPRGGATSAPVAGHVELGNIGRVGAKVFPDGTGELLLVVEDDVSEDPDVLRDVVIAVYFVAGVDASLVATGLLQRVVRDRVADPAFVAEAERFPTWQAAVSRGIHPLGDAMDVIEIAPFRAVRRRDLAERRPASVSPGWDVLGVVAHGAESNGLYPVPTVSDAGVVLAPGETVVLSQKISRLSLARDVGRGDWYEFQRITRSPGHMLFTDQRVIFVFADVPEPQRARGAPGADPPISQAGSFANESYVGHLPLAHVAALGARDLAKGLDNHIFLSLAIEDASNPASSKMVMIRVTTKGLKFPSGLANDLLPRIVRERMARAAPADVAELQALGSFRYKPRGEELLMRAIPGHTAVGPRVEQPRGPAPTGFAPPGFPPPALLPPSGPPTPPGTLPPPPVLSDK
jgi:hypothetical protein